MGEITINVPTGSSGDWKVEEFEISEKGAALANLRASFRDRRFVVPGKFKKLTCGGQIVMSNTPSEIADLAEFIREATHGGHILINGLGLGVALTGILKSEAVVSVTVIEIEPHVIALVGPTYLKDNRVRIICADALEWRPPKGSRYSIVWHDIWNNICGDNLDEMKRLHRRYGHYTHWQFSWCREECLWAAK